MGDELKNIRRDLEHLRENLKWAEAAKDQNRVQDLTNTIEKGESRDPEQVYLKALKVIGELEKSSPTKVPDKDAQKETWNQIASEARSCITRFQLDGLWVGNYPGHGYEMINVTYSGDNIIATKVTGDKNIPRGAISFKADLSPLSQASCDLSPIELSSESSTKWGIDKLSRFNGQGMIANEGFKKSKFVDGQFIMFDNHFSFVWIPTRQHVFFGRPSPDVTFRMLRDIISKEDELENMRNHLEECLEMDMTTSIARSLSESHEESFRRIRREKELRDLMEEQATSSRQTGFANFFNVQKWRVYLDDVLNRDKKE